MIWQRSSGRGERTESGDVFLPSVLGLVIFGHISFGIFGWDVWGVGPEWIVNSGTGSMKELSSRTGSDRASLSEANVA